MTEDVIHLSTVPELIIDPLTIKVTITYDLGDYHSWVGLVIDSGPVLGNEAVQDGRFVLP